MRVKKQTKKIIKTARLTINKNVKPASRHIKKLVTYVNKTTRYFIRNSIRILRAGYKRLRLYAFRTALLLHRYFAKKPHVYFMTRSAGYKRWHSWDKHKIIHSIALGIYFLMVGMYIFGSYSKTLAVSDLFDNWNFSNPSDYSLGSGVEISGGSTRLKALNYTDDANTAALYHMDESSGSVVSDSSSNNNNGVASNSSFVAGNLNNAIDLNGTTSKVAVPDSASLSLTQQNTLEAWTKHRNNFSAGSTSQRQVVADKGEYQLYYDNETGKVTYELADSAANSWSQAGGNDTNNGWDQNGKRSVNAYVKMGSDVYAAIGADVGDAEVWRWNGTTWTKIGGGPTSINNSWSNQTYEGAYALTTDGTNIYAGLGSTAGDAEVWRWNGTTWTKIGGDAISGSWAIGTFETVWSLNFYSGNLYVGLGSSASDADVWRYNGSTWAQIGGDGFNGGWAAGYENVASLTNDGTNLYAGLGASANDAEVWRWNGTTWTKIGGDSTNSGWTVNYETVRSLAYAGGTLYAGLGDTTTDAEVWSWNGTVWSQIGGDGLSSSWNTNYEYVSSLTSNGTDVYAGLGSGDGDGEVWKLNSGTWSQIGGDGISNSWATALGDSVNALLIDGTTLYAGTIDGAGTGLAYTYNGSAWTQIGGNHVNKSWGYYGAASVRVTQVVGSYMYAGLGDASGSALVWQFDGSTWQLIGGQGVNGSWAANTYEQVMSMSSYNNKLYVGLGTGANDAEVWEWNGSSWTQVGGDSLNTGWLANYEEVSAMASYGGYLYAGIGSSANDAEVWRYNGSVWSKIGGDSTNSGWTTNYDRVSSMTFYNGKLVVGLGATSGEAEVWEWSGSTWSKIGGDAISGSWAVSGYEQVETLIPGKDKLYAGLGNSADDAEIWEYNGSSWSKIGGDDVNTSWTAGTYERVKTMAMYNGDLLVGLGASAGDSEIWKYNGSSWSRIGGNSVNGSWTNVIEEVESMSVYKGKVYAGVGQSANSDAGVWSWGNNGYLESTTSSFNTSWHHIAATYDGATMKIYIDGALDSSVAASITMPDSQKELLLGAGYSGRETGRAVGKFDGQIDEVRISNTARSLFTSKPFSTTPQTVTLDTPVRQSGVWHWDGLASNETTNGGSITYRLSDDGGSTWKFWNGSAWSVSASTAEANPISVTNSNIFTFPVTFAGIKWQAVLSGNGTQQVALNSLDLSATSDYDEPSANVNNLTASKVSGGTLLAQNDWTNGGSPYFSWDSATDAQSGIKGYCLYLGNDNTADPVSTKGLLGTSPVTTGGNCQFIVDSLDIDTGISGYLATPLATSDNPYYLRIKAIDNAGNTTTGTAQFHIRFDNTPPSNPGYVTSPSGFVNNKEVELTWPTSGGNAPNDPNSGLAGLQYKIGSTDWYGDTHSGLGDIDDLLANDGSYTTIDPTDFNNLVEGVNTVYFRTWDQAGNVTSNYVTAAIKVNTSGSPSEPQSLNASPSSNIINSFSFDWDPPTTFVGDVNNLTYCYTINTLPSPSTCTFTSGGITSLGAGPYATQPGSNTFYVAARDESNNINYSSYATTTFMANTPSPGLTLNTDIVDVSIKSTSNWRLALTWDPPTYVGAGIASYKIYRSTDNSFYTFVGSSSSTTYIDAGLTQQRYYYYITACDSTNNCGANSSSVNAFPTGKFTTSAQLIAEPSVSSVTTKRAKVSWSTDRASDSKIAIGTSSGVYGQSEVSKSAQESSHTIDLDNLSAGTTYYFVAKWTDEDGNTGVSQEYSFTTSPAPTLKEIGSERITLSSATIRFTSRESYKADIVYGASESFGGVVSLNTAPTESTYTANLQNLTDGTKYYYKIVTYDGEGNKYDGSIFSFTTPARPKISNLRFQPIDGEPTSTQRVTWNTNVSSNSTVSYGRVGSVGIDVHSSNMVTEHEVVIRDMEDDAEYFLVAQSRDSDGNLATSDQQVFHTALDTRAPEVYDVTVESSVRGTGAEARGQIVISWRTDEPSTSQVAFSEGSNVTSFNNKTAEDTAHATEHIVIVSDLPTSRVYTVKPVSRDKANNAGTGESQTAIIGRASDSVLTIVFNTLKKVFGY